MTVQSEDKPKDDELAAVLAPAQPPIEEKGQILDVSAAYTLEEERRVLRKIDCTILPIVSQLKQQPRTDFVVRC